MIGLTGGFGGDWFLLLTIYILWSSQMNRSIAAHSPSELGIFYRIHRSTLVPPWKSHQQVQDID